MTIHLLIARIAVTLSVAQNRQHVAGLVDVLRAPVALFSHGFFRPSFDNRTQSLSFFIIY